MLKLIFFISGVAGLIYQTVWVREFGHIFGNTFQSASIVMGVFVFNLGLGSYIGGYLVDKYHKKEPRAGLAGYIGAEIIIALFGLILAFAIPLLEPLSALISTYEVGANGWNELSSFSYFLRYFISTALLMVPTLCMGATLTFLIRFVLQNRTDEAGLHTGVLYGVNTLGAAAGCFFVDTIGIPIFGLMSTKLFAVLLNIAAVYFSVLIFKRQSDSPLIIHAEKHTEPLSHRFLKELSPTSIGVAIFISGFAAMGLEIIWFRYLASLLASTRETFSFLLGFVLIGIWIGASLAGRLSVRKVHAGWIFIWGQLGLAISALGLMYAFTWINYPGTVAIVLRHQDQLSETAFNLASHIVFWPILFLVLPPAIFMGFAFPAANAVLQDDPDKVGKTTGHIYIWNSTGSLLGSLSAGFILLPNLGSQASFILLGGIALVAIIPIAISIIKTEKFKFRPTFVAASIVALSFIVLWSQKPASLLLTTSYRADPRGQDGTVLAKSEGLTESLVITEHKLDASGESYKRLNTNGHSMSATAYHAQRYMRAFSHIPLLQIDKPTDVLVICFGVGNTAHSASLHPTVENIEVADISKNILSHANYFADSNFNIIENPKVKVFVNDGRQHLRMKRPGSYDLVTLEPPPLIHAGVASLYGVEFYELAHRALKPGGYVSQWWPAYQLDSDHSKSLIAAFLKVFPNAVLLHGADREFILLGQKDGPNEVDYQKLIQNLSERDEVQEDLRRVKMASVVDILGSFVSGRSQLKKATLYFEPVSDNFPTMEYQGSMFRGYLEPIFFNTQTFSEWCPSCIQDGKIAKELSDLPDYLALKQSIYWAPYFSILRLSESEKKSIRWPAFKVSEEKAESYMKKYEHLNIFLRKIF